MGAIEEGDICDIFLLKHHQCVCYGFDTFMRNLWNLILNDGGDM